MTSRAVPTSYEEAVKTMKAALNSGSNLWNGGEFYGPPDANSLQLLKHYFTMYPEDRDRVYLSMKGAFSFHPMGMFLYHVLDEFNLAFNSKPFTQKPKLIAFEKTGPDNSPENVRKSIDNCLTILGDKVAIDNWEPARADPKVSIETTMQAIAKYVEVGKVGAIGLSEVSADKIRRAHAVHPISTVEVELSLFTTDP